MRNEERCKAGLCCDCDATIKKWTEGEIQEAKDDIGMTADDDFADVCISCLSKYTDLVTTGEN